MTTVQLDLEVINCWVCGCTFAMSSELKNSMKGREETLFCPKGCRLGLGEPHWKKDMQRLRESEGYYKQRAIEHRERAEQVERKLTATKGVVTRFKNRIAKGACPCCEQSFADLHDHMKTQHPDYVNHDDE